MHTTNIPKGKQTKFIAVCQTNQYIFSSLNKKCFFPSSWLQWVNIGGEWTGTWCCYCVMTLTLLQSRGREMFRSVLYSVSSSSFLFYWGSGVGEGGRDWLGRRKD